MSKQTMHASSYTIPIILEPRAQNQIGQPNEHAANKRAQGNPIHYKTDK